MSETAAPRTRAAKLAAEPPPAPTAPATDAAVIDYLVALSRASYDRECQQGESMWRALPFFATAIGLLINVLAGQANALPTSLSLYAMFCYSAVLASLILLGVSGYYVWVAAIPRKYQTPPLEIETCKYEATLREHHLKYNATGDIEALVLLDLKRHILQEYSQAASQNRDANDGRTQARGRALKFYLWAALAAVLVPLAGFVTTKLIPTVANIVSRLP